MGYDDFDSGDDDLSEMLIMEEMDAEDRRMDEEGYHGGGCLTSVILFLIVPAVAIIAGLKLLLG